MKRLQRRSSGLRKWGKRASKKTRCQWSRWKAPMLPPPLGAFRYLSAPQEASAMQQLASRVYDHQRLRIHSPLHKLPSNMTKVLQLHISFPP
jgi:hypothetical protein